MACYMAIVCRRLRVRASVLLPKVLPSYIIALTTASASAAFSTVMEINEHKLGIAPVFSRTAVPIGGMVFAGMQTMVYTVTGVFLAERCGVPANIAWWITLWIVCTLFTMATPPVGGGAIVCLSLLMAQMNIPEEMFPVGVTLSMLLDFIATGSRVFVLHMETLLQANRLEFLDTAVLQSR